MWRGFDPTAYTRETFAKRVDRLPAMPWCKGITLHNTAAPTLAQWAESGPAHAARLRNLQHYYEQQRGWHAGPHLFVSRNFINGFSDLTRPGVHSRCFNSTHIGIEMVGDFAREQFDSGDGAKVRDNAVFAMAVLFRKLGLTPERNLTFHKECKLDNHDCPGRLVRKDDIIARVRRQMDELDGGGQEPEPDEPVEQEQPAGRFEVFATEFGGEDDPQDSYYGGKVDGDSYEVALPARVPENKRTVRVGRGGKSVVARVNDLGPWNRSDNYWDRGERPRAEAQKRERRKADNGRVPANDAGIDLTPAIMDALDVPGKSGTRSARVWWKFSDDVASLAVTEPAPAEEPAPTQKRGLAKAAAWISGVFSTGALSIFYDWRVIALLLFAAAILIALFVDIRHIRALVRKATGDWIGGEDKPK